MILKRDDSDRQGAVVLSRLLCRIYIRCILQSRTSFENSEVQLRAQPNDQTDVVARRTPRIMDAWLTAMGL